MLKRCLILLLCAAVSAPALAGGYGGRFHYGGYHHGHHGGSGDVLLAGLVIGGLLGFFVSEDRHYRRHAYPSRRYHRRNHYSDYHADYGYRDDIHYREYVRVEPAPRRVVIRKHPELAGRSCRMTREYTTTIEIDGRARAAYGTRCMTADGSWVLGAPKLVPDFE